MPTCHIIINYAPKATDTAASDSIYLYSMLRVHMDVLGR